MHLCNFSPSHRSISSLRGEADLLSIIQTHLVSHTLEWSPLGWTDGIIVMGGWVLKETEFPPGQHRACSHQFLAISKGNSSTWVLGIVVITMVFQTS